MAPSGRLVRRYVALAGLGLIAINNLIGRWNRIASQERNLLLDSSRISDQHPILTTSHHNKFTEKPAVAQLKQNPQERLHRENHENDREVLQSWRQLYVAQCHNASASNQEVLATLETMIRPPLSALDLSGLTPVATATRQRKSLAEEATFVVPCKFTFLDFGANIGDSLGKFIESRMEACPEKGIPLHTPHLDLELGRVRMDPSRRKPNVLVQTARTILEEYNRYPEEYCYYGVEGNPLFTSRLKAIEGRIMEAKPRPIQQAYFFTETVGAGRDEPTVLYLDTINQNQNYWGSSLFSSHQDVQRSMAAAATAAEKQQKAVVQGRTLSSLLEQTVQKVIGSHVIIKMDIEGSEYDVLEEAYQSGVLCDFAQSEVTIHLILETHHPDVIGKTDFDLEHWKEVKRAFTACGVKVRKGRDAGR